MTAESATDFFACFEPSLLIEIAPFAAVILIESLSPEYQGKWSRVYDHYKDEDLNFLDELNTTDRQAVKTNTESYAEYTADYQTGFKSWLLTLSSAIFVFLGKLSAGIQAPSWFGAFAAISVLLILAVWLTVWRTLDDRSPHNYKAGRGRLLQPFTIIGSNLILVGILATSYFWSCF